jgi:hypothetical protein
MIKTEIDILFSGDKLSIKDLKKKLKVPIKTLVEYDEIAKLGRYKNKPSPYGLGVLTVDNTKLGKILSVLVNNFKVLQESGVDRIFLSVKLGNKNFFLSFDDLIKLTMLNADIEVWK